METGGSGGTSRRPSRLTGGTLLALVALAASGLAGASAATVDPATLPANVLIVITDDQPWDTLDPRAMPWLADRLRDADDRWVRFPNAFVEVPMCCPSRASILTGRYARHTGVLDNGDGASFDESATLATWLDEAGYQTALIGKYLNGYAPSDADRSYVPPGWDYWAAGVDHDAYSS